MTVTVHVEDAREVDSGDTVEVARWQQLAQQALVTEGASGELSLTFIDEAEIASLNAEHMGVDGPTDVLSFPLDDDAPAGVPRLLGDIVIAPSVAARQFDGHAGTYDDEMALLVVHGVLHILGHDHAADDEAELMRRRERALLEAHHWSGRAPHAFRHTHDD